MRQNNRGRGNNRLPEHLGHTVPPNKKKKKKGRVVLLGLISASCVLLELGIPHSPI